MSVATLGGVITFTYASSSLFTSVKMESAYRSKTIRAEKGEPLVDDFAMTDDELDLFNGFLTDNVSKVLKPFLNLTYGITDAITTNVSGNVVLKINDKANYNTNLLNYTDKTIKDLLVYKLLSEWYRSNGLEAEYKRIDFDYETTRKELIRKIFELRKPLIS